MIAEAEEDAAAEVKVLHNANIAYAALHKSFSVYLSYVCPVGPICPAVAGS